MSSNREQDPLTTRTLNIPSSREELGELNVLDAAWDTWHAQNNINLSSIVIQFSGTGSCNFGISAGSHNESSDGGKYEKRPWYVRRLIIRNTAQISFRKIPTHLMTSDSRSTSAIIPHENVKKEVYLDDAVSYDDKSILATFPLHIKNADSTTPYFSLFACRTLIASPLLVPPPIMPNFISSKTVSESDREFTPCNISAKRPSPPIHIIPSYCLRLRSGAAMLPALSFRTGQFSHEAQSFACPPC
mmetsp:Transcript_13394/g.20354  ORF Transcript_13394/g.20354 Transcript_13394/m.20354 type:complete len:245 (+) Transcript_13394:256-990(+)